LTFLYITYLKYILNRFYTYSFFFRKKEQQKRIKKKNSKKELKKRTAKKELKKRTAKRIRN